MPKFAKSIPKWNDNIEYVYIGTQYQKLPQYFLNKNLKMNYEKSILIKELIEKAAKCKWWKGQLSYICQIGITKAQIISENSLRT